MEPNGAEMEPKRLQKALEWSSNGAEWSSSGAGGFSGGSDGVVIDKMVLLSTIFEFVDGFISCSVNANYPGSPAGIGNQNSLRNSMG